MYRVLTDFSDLQDNEHVYRAGDEFPRSDFSVTEKRIKELMSFSNKRNRPLIELVDCKSEDTDKSAEVDVPVTTTTNGEEVTKKPRKSRKKALKGADDGKDAE